MSNDTLDPDEGMPVQRMTLDELRRSIRPMTVLQRVERAALGQEDMTNEELNAAKLFLAKSAPDLKSVEVIDATPVRELSDAELDRRIAECLARAGQAGTPGPVDRAGTTH